MSRLIKQVFIGLLSFSKSINLNRCIGSCYTLNDLSNRICVPNKTEDLNMRINKTYIMLM